MMAPHSFSLRLAFLIAATLTVVHLPTTSAASGTYVRGSVQPDFVYPADQAVQVPFTAAYFKDNVPQTDLVKVSVQWKNRTAFPVHGAEDLDLGVRPYPATNILDFGQLEPGFYDLRVVVKAGSLSRDIFLEFSVSPPAIPYAASLQARSDGSAEFFFAATHPNANETFRIQVYTDGANGRRSLQEVREHNATHLTVPYLAGQIVKVDVTDPNGWVNHENPTRDAVSGFVSYKPWISNPDFRDAQQYKDTWWVNKLLPISLLVAAGGLLIWTRRSRARPGGESLE